MEMKIKQMTIRYTSALIVELKVIICDHVLAKKYIIVMKTAKSKIIANTSQTAHTLKIVRNKIVHKLKKLILFWNYLNYLRIIILNLRICVEL